MAQSDNPQRPKDRRFWLGVGLTVIYSFGFLIYALIRNDAVLELKPDEFAQFLGGVFAPLAFFWLVLGFLQQGEELRNSADALRLQEEELHNLVEQQAELVAVTRCQLQHDQDRANAAEQQARRLARPTLVIRGGMSTTSADKPNQIVKRFTLANVGTTCTRVRVDFDGLRETARIASLTNGDERHYDLAFDLDSFHAATIKVAYLDGRGEEGWQDFTIRKVRDTVSIAYDWDNQAAACAGG